MALGQRVYKGYDPHAKLVCEYFDRVARRRQGRSGPRWFACAFQLDPVLERFIARPSGHLQGAHLASSKTQLEYN